jgi:hypothetical protein
MRYLMIVATDPDLSVEDAARAPSIETGSEQVTASGAWVMGERLRPTSDATTVRVRNGELLITDGPFTESKEWIAGFDILDCADLDAAIEIAASHPMAFTGRLELRPFWPFDEN